MMAAAAAAAAAAANRLELIVSVDKCQGNYGYLQRN